MNTVFGFEHRDDRAARLADRLAVFVAEAQLIVDENIKKYPACGGPGRRSEAKRIITVERGRRYARLVTVSAENPDSRSVYGFVDMLTGDVFRAESWKKPNKRGAVGNILEPMNTWICLGLHGVCGR